jgi:hypothetical protein
MAAGEAKKRSMEGRKYAVRFVVAVTDLAWESLT